MKYLFKISSFLLFVCLLVGCKRFCNHPSHSPVSDSVKRNSIYYWKTRFELDSYELDFLKRHDISRIYLRMFDVVTEYYYFVINVQIIPNATVKFDSNVPEGIEIVPVTYITLDALREMRGHEDFYARLIAERMLAIASFNNCGKVNELQLDCDWTSSTKDIYDRLCGLVKDSLQSKGMELSVTVRLHQLKESAPPAHRGVLMLYNTGALKNPKTKNSILDIRDVLPYLRHKHYPIPLDYAYPTYGWGIMFENNEFVSIVSADSVARSKDMHIRYERPTATEILKVKQLVHAKMGNPASGNILYHLDHSQLKNFSEDEITQILNN